jgi:hypothetical protein
MIATDAEDSTRKTKKPKKIGDTRIQMHWFHFVEVASENNWLQTFLMKWIILWKALHLN